jgi:putative ABC transport system substrate-binding protein
MPPAWRLSFPLETQFNWIQKILPDAKTIGVMYNPEENKERIDAALRIAHSRGLTLEAQEVYTLQDVPSALNTLSKSVDVLWGLADNLALSPQIAKNVLLVSFRNSIPFIGPSSAWVRAGALYSLDWDYTDMGAQCGEMALRVLQGTPPSAIPPAAPRKVMYSLNLKTAQQLKITISEQITQKARNTY